MPILEREPMKLLSASLFQNGKQYKYIDIRNMWFLKFIDV